MDDVISSVNSSTQTQEDRIEALNIMYKDVEEFTADVVTIDHNAADAINKSKDDFYNKHSYLMPECEKSYWEKFKEGCKKVGEWCREHWKAIVTVVLVITAVVIIVSTAGTALGPITQLLLMVAEGILIGTTNGGLAGGIVNAATGGSFWEGMENGAFSGAISGALTGGMSSWLSGGARTLSLGEIMFIGAVADTEASLLSDLGDIVIKGEDVSLGEVLFNAGFSFFIGGIFSGSAYAVTELFPLKIPGINKGDGSWAHVWASQATRSLRYGYKVSLKTILKGFGARFLNDIWNYLFEPIKNSLFKSVDS